MSMTPKNVKIEPEKHMGTVEIFPALLGRRQGDLLEGMGRRRLRRHKPKLQVEAMTAKVPTARRAVDPLPPFLRAA